MKISLEFNLFEIQSIVIMQMKKIIIIRPLERNLKLSFKNLHKKVGSAHDLPRHHILLFRFLFLVKRHLGVVITYHSFRIFKIFQYCDSSVISVEERRVRKCYQVCAHSCPNLPLVDRFLGKIYTAKFWKIRQMRYFSKT